MILTCGEALIDVFVEPGEGLSRPAVFTAGGSPFNTALALARQGAAAGFFGGLSNDRFGMMLRGILDAEGVAHDLAPALPNKTTLSIVSRDRDGHPSYDFRGVGGADLALTWDAVPAQLPAACRAVALSSYPLVLDPVRDAMRGIAQLAARDRVVSIDINYRPSLVGDRHVWAERFAPYETLATIMKASEEDVALAYGGERTAENAAAHWLDRGAALVLITRGARGASVFSPGRQFDMDAPAVTVSDTVGAGDCFHAGFLAALDRQGALSRPAVTMLSDNALRSALAWAITTASLNVTRRGTNPPHRHEIEAALAVPTTRRVKPGARWRACLKTPIALRSSAPRMKAYCSIIRKARLIQRPWRSCCDWLKSTTSQTSAMRCLQARSLITQNGGPCCTALYAAARILMQRRR